uniref:Elsinochromes biosynthesis cluster protein HP4 n=1 Tax=Elsinoe fawcettii TaxID=40997 RepID=HP4_ELSFA|nr:RecName: Full=Elsinochromes biosynthesis cluster protein HP4 [Elsinoe fawcettii]ABZ82012.1 hypothetical protein EfHP4 [Elsinoe fawcettii]
MDRSQALYYPWDSFCLLSRCSIFILSTTLEDSRTLLSHLGLQNPHEVQGTFVPEARVPGVRLEATAGHQSLSEPSGWVYYRHKHSDLVDPADLHLQGASYRRSTIRSYLMVKKVLYLVSSAP